MNKIAVPVLLGVLALLGLRTEDAQSADADIARVQKALGTKLAGLSDKEQMLSEILQLLGKATGENFVLDPTLPKSVGEQKVTVRAKADGTVLDAFSVTLALTGLRYSILDGVIYISTEGKLSDRLIGGQGASEPVASIQARRPLSVSDAVGRSQPFDPYQDHFVHTSDFIGHYPWRLWEPPRYNSNTGLTDFPGPPVDIDSPQVGHPRFRYTSIPYFLKPEFLAYEQEKREYREERDVQDRAERQANARALAALLQLLKDNPNLKADDILKKLGADK